MPLDVSREMKNIERFYKNGIRFECQGSGKCCITRSGYSFVYLSFNDRKRIAAHFGISTRQFTGQYAQKTDGLYHLKDPEGDCPFFSNNRCDIYESRPQQCRTWPFWPENMKKIVWENEIVPSCPGIGTGKLYTAEEIEDILEIDRTA